MTSVLTPDAQGWRDLGRAFEQLGERARLEADYYPDGGLPRCAGPHTTGVSGVVGTWYVYPVRASTTDDVREFQRLARAAAVAAGCPDHADSWVYWLDGIYRNQVTKGEADAWEMQNPDWYQPEIGPQRQNDTERSVIYRAICGTSARYCMFLAARGAEPPHAPSVQSLEVTATPSNAAKSAGEPCSWGNVLVEFTSDNQLQVKASGRLLAPQNYSELGCEDGRTHVPNKAWLALRQLAEASDDLQAAGGQLECERLGPQYEKRLQDIRRLLRAYLGREGFMIPPDSDPLPCKGGSVRPLFRIGTRPSYQK